VVSGFAVAQGAGTAFFFVEEGGVDGKNQSEYF
jgi:hypothetical protein